MFNFKLLSFYSYDEDCKGFSILEIGMMDRSLFSIHSDEDGVYLCLFWIDCGKIKPRQ